VSIAGSQGSGAAELTLVKPFDAKELVATVRRPLDRTAIATGVAAAGPQEP
jgi:DNA-binding response OmpR family regulator